MRTLIQKYQSTAGEYAASVVKIFSIIMLCGMGSFLQAQVDCNTTMACNDLVQVSLDENCQVTITADMMMEDPEYDNSFYTIVITDLAGNELPSTTVDYSNVNQTYNVAVTLTGCPASCWGSIKVEDKLPPVPNCTNVVVDCDADLTPGSADVPAPTASDACSFVSDISYTETVETNACANDFIKTITRFYTFTDEQGNQAFCEQIILVQKATIATVVFPPNYDDLDEPSFECDVTLELLPNGAPSPESTGYPTGANCANIQTYYTDIIFDVCGASRKILRQWVVVDWCTGEEISENQTIKILDTKAPVCTANPDFLDEILTDEGECTGTYEVPAPIVIFECSDYTYSVGYKLRDEDGNPFENPIYDNVTYNSSTGLYTITELPQDTTWIVYTLTDACGNSRMCFTEVLVVDEEAPTPVCEGYTVVGLEDIGWADIFATSVDDGSTDNCEIDRYEVKRLSTNCGIFSDLSFGEKVNFCCEDISAGYIEVVMRVYDVSGNYNDCIVNVSVQDKLNPTITCPSNITISCEQDYTDLSLTGNATAEDNCSAALTHSDNVNLNDCGKGTVVRTFTATDPQGRIATCTQTIIVGDNTPFGANNISWPADMDIDGCDGSLATPELLNSFPILSNTGCTDIAISYDDNVFYNTPEYCVKVLRHWKVVDWCNYDPQNPEFYEYTQKIGVTNSQAPTFTACEDETVVSEDGDCQEQVTITATATDDCTSSNQLKYTWAIDLDSNGSNDMTGVSNSITRTLSSGTHTVYWTVTDACGNISNCNSTVTVTDTKAPTPICLGGVVWGLDEDGLAEVWASDFNLKSEDGCTAEEDLVYAFNEAGTMTSMSFDCTDIPNGISEEIPLEMYVFDTDGNFSFCSVTLTLEDSNLNNACEDTSGKATLAGRIVNNEFEGMENIEVELMDTEAQDVNMDMTANDGEFMFDNVAYYGQYIVAPYKNDDVRNGISTLDLVLIQRHILELQELGSPYAIIAADVTGNDKLSSSDLLQLRKVILGIDNTFGDNTSYRFIPTTYVIEDADSPWGFPEKVTYDELYLSDMDIDFTAIKVGDVNGDATNLKGDNEASTRGAALTLMASDAAFSAGEEVTIPVYANDVDELIGMQMAMNFDGLTFQNIKAGVLNVASENVMVAGNAMKISWNASSAIEVNRNDVLFEMVFKAITSGNTADAIAIDNKSLTAEMYDASLVSHDIELSFESRTTEVLTSKLYQNTPNPFKGMTAIGFDLEAAGLATVRLFDITGKELYRITDDFQKGYNEMTIDVRSLGISTGVVYYQLKVGEFTQTNKMMIIE